MRALLQRVQQASVTVEGQVGGQVAGEIGPGLCVFLGVGQGDTTAQADQLAEKVVNLRIFNDPQGKFNLSLLDVKGQVLVVSQFTLYADARKGRRPNFIQAAPPELAQELYLYFVQKLKSLGVSHVPTGVFGAHMEVRLCNDGPVTIWLDTQEK